MSELKRADYCAIACAELFRGDGEIMISPMTPTAAVGARLARATFEPEILLTDGMAEIVAGNWALGTQPDPNAREGWMPFRSVFDTLWWGKRHVVMGASQIDKYGNQNISAIGDYAKPKAQLVGVRGAPSNTIYHTTSYVVPNHSVRSFVESVDVVSGVGYDNIKKLHPASQTRHEIRAVISNLGVFDFQTDDNRMRIRSLHPGVSVEEVVEATGFELVIPDNIPTTRAPSAEELRLLNEVVDPKGIRFREVPA